MSEEGMCFITVGSQLVAVDPVSPEFKKYSEALIKLATYASSLAIQLKDAAESEGVDSEELSKKIDKVVTDVCVTKLRALLFNLAHGTNYDFDDDGEGEDSEHE